MITLQEKVLIEKFSDDKKLAVDSFAWWSDHRERRGRSKSLVKIVSFNTAEVLGGLPMATVKVCEIPPSHARQRFATTTVESQSIMSAALETDQLENIPVDDLVPLGALKVTRYAISRAKDVAIQHFPGAVIALVIFTRQRRSLEWVIALADHIGNAHAHGHPHAHTNTHKRTRMHTRIYVRTPRR